MKYIYLAILVLLIGGTSSLNAQTSWKGTTSTAWSTASNWTAGVPTSTVDAIIGDANFTGSFQPTFTATSTCKSLTIGGSVNATLTVNKTLTVYGNLTINSGSTISHGAVSLSVKGNWYNYGTYSATSTTANVKFAGTTQSINGPVATSFRRLTINSGSTTTLNINASVSVILTVSGTFVPAEVATPYVVSGAATTTVGSAGTLKVNAATYAGNYALSGAVTLSAGSTVEYAATLVNQTVKENLTYSTLRISGALTKTLGGNLNALNSATSTRGNIYVTAGTFDMAGFTANRGTAIAGGTLSVSNGATLKIGNSNTFPINYTTYTLSLTSTVEYYGSGAQTVAARTYGNLILSSSSGSSSKTMPATAFTIAGNFTTTIGSGTAVTCTAGADMTVSGTVTIGTSTTFDGSSYTHRVAGNWVNNGTYTGSTSTIIINASGGILSGTGNNNFYNLTLGASNITSTGISIAVAGDLSTTGAGSFTQATGATVTMTGTSKTITGTGFIFDNLSITGSVLTAAGFTVKGNLITSGSLSCSAGNVILSGSVKTISGAGVISFNALSVSGTITSSSNISIASALDISGSLTATAGNTTFTGTSTLNGTANLYKVTLNGTSLQLSTNAVLGIADSLKINSGTLNVASSTPNTVAFNGAGAQPINSLTYHHLMLSGSSTKTAQGAIVSNGDLTISSGTTFNAATYTHSIYGNWINNGTFSPGTSNVTFLGAADASITGATTFATLTVNKSSASNQVNLLNNVAAPTVSMTSGILSTGSNTLTITGTRSGNGVILGNIQRTHTFTTGTSYEFESPYNTITFASVSGVTTITVNVTKSGIADFPFGGSINRVYNISIPSGTYAATLRLHYEDGELNGNSESSMQMWGYNGAAWVNNNKSGNSVTNNYVEQSGLSNITNRWTLSDNANVAVWTGALSGDWSNAGNWTITQGTPSLPPSLNDVAQIGTSVFSYQPTISTAASAKNIMFGSTQAVTLSLAAGGSLTTQGNIGGTWSTNTTHTINANNQTLNIGGDLVLSDGTSGHAINLNTGAGTINISGALTQSGGANVIATGSAGINIGGNYSYSSGTFTAGTSTVTFNGTVAQLVAGLTYNNVAISKASGIAAVNTAANITGNLTISSGELDLNAASTIAGNVTVASGATLNGDGITTSVGGNWNNSGTFISLSGTINFNGTGAQAITTTTFNNLTINKASGTATLAGNLLVNGNLTITAGNLDLSTYTANRSSLGGIVSIADAAGILIAGANNFPQNYATYALGSNSFVNYSGTVNQSVASITYGNLTFSNGGNNAKILTGPTTVNGDVLISNGASFDAGSSSLGMYGNWTNNGIFIPSTSTLLFQGTGKTINGTATFNKTAIYGSYMQTGGNLTFNGTLRILSGGSFNAGTGSDTVKGDLFNSGSLTSNGTTTFTGTVVQNISFINALVSNSFGVINFNGSVSPVLNSTSTPTFATLNVNNTAGINPSVPWIIGVAFNISSGATFNGGISTHNIYGAFTNNGTVTSTGTLVFAPVSPQTIKLSGTAFTSTGTVIFGGTAAMSITGTPTVLNDVVISNTAGVTPAVGWNIGRNFSINNNGIFNAGSLSYTVAGDIESDGTLNGGTSTFTTTSASGLIDGSASTTFYNYVNTGSIAVNSDFNVAHDFTNNGTFVDTIGSVIFTGASNGTIGGSTAPFRFSQFEVNKSVGSIITLAKAVTNVTELNITGGILDAAAFSIAQDATGGVLRIDDYATLRIGGTNSLPTFNTYILDTFSNVEYTGTSQAIPATVAYGNLIITTGTKTALGHLHINNDLIISGGTFNTGGFSDTLGGNFNMTAGSFAAGNTVYLNGIGNQDIHALTAFNNLTVNKSSGLVTQSTNDSVSGALTLVNGKISLGNYNLFVATPVSGGSSVSYVVASGTGNLLVPVSNGGSRVFPVGNSTNYLPVSISLTAASVTDTLGVRIQDSTFTAGSYGTTRKSAVVNATWQITEQTPGGTNATVTLQWPAAIELSGFNRTNCRLAHYTNGNWDYGAPLVAAGVNPYTVSRSGITGFSPFTVANFYALPLTWLSFTGYCDQQDHHLIWTTADERGNSHFVIERSLDGANFSEEGIVMAEGANAGNHTYSYLNRHADASVMYYRIRQVDNDGQSTYSKTIRINGCAGSGNAVALQLQNPVAGSTLSLSINVPTGNTVAMRIVDIAGKVVFRKVIPLIAGNNSIALSIPDLSPGMYYLQYIDNNQHMETFKFFRQ